MPWLPGRPPTEFSLPDRPACNEIFNEIKFIARTTTRSGRSKCCAQTRYKRQAYLLPNTVIPWARTGTFPPMGSTVGENGSVNVPSGFTLSV